MNKREPVNFLETDYGYAEQGDSVKVVVLEIDGSSGDEELELDMASLLRELFEVFKAKQASYGPKNISTFGERGVVVRLNDKLQRLIRMVWEDRDDPIDDETVDDTYLDLADYALIALLVRGGVWPD